MVPCQGVTVPGIGSKLTIHFGNHDPDQDKAASKKNQQIDYLLNIVLNIQGYGSDVNGSNFSSAETHCSICIKCKIFHVLTKTFLSISQFASETDQA